MVAAHLSHSKANLLLLLLLFFCLIVPAAYAPSFGSLAIRSGPPKQRRGTWRESAATGACLTVDGAMTGNRYLHPPQPLCTLRMLTHYIIMKAGNKKKKTHEELYFCIEQGFLNIKGCSFVSV